ADLAKTRNFARMSALHTQGKVIYWGFQNLEPPEAEQLANEFSRVSGFTPIRFIDSYAGYKDWFIQAFRGLGFTIELGLGTNPLPVELFLQMYEEALGVLVANLYMPEKYTVLVHCYFTALKSSLRNPPIRLLLSIIK